MESITAAVLSISLYLPFYECKCDILFFLEFKTVFTNSFRVEYPNICETFSISERNIFRNIRALFRSEHLFHVELVWSCEVQLNSISFLQILYLIFFVFIKDLV